MAKKGFAGSSSGSAYDTNQGGSGQSGNGRGAAARDKVSNLGSSASQKLDESPLVALGAGVALGAVLGAVLPVTRKEKEVLAPLGTKLHTAGLEAVDRARDMSKQKFDEVAGETVRNFFSSGGSSSGGGASAGGANG